MTGGTDMVNDLSSTEMMVKGQDTSWSIIPDSLPARLRSQASLSYNNQVVTMGKL